MKSTSSVAMLRAANLFIVCICCSAVRSLSTDGIVLFGDSLSDDGNGYAGNAKFVLRTNQVMNSNV